MPLLYNPTPDPIVTKYDGAVYAFKPEERREIFNPYAASHMIRRWGRHGLVDITFNDRIAKKYMDHELYVHDQRLAGITKLLETLYEQRENFRSYDDECGDKKTHTRFKLNNEAKKVDVRIEKVEALLESMQSRDSQEFLDMKAKELKKKAQELEEQARRLSGNNTGKSSKSGSNRATGS